MVIIEVDLRHTIQILMIHHQKQVLHIKSIKKLKQSIITYFATFIV